MEQLTLTIRHAENGYILILRDPCMGFDRYYVQNSLGGVFDLIGELLEKGGSDEC